MSNREHALLQGVIGDVLCNTGNFPEEVQPYLLGQDIGPLIDKTVGAVLAALSTQPAAGMTPDEFKWAIHAERKRQIKAGYTPAHDDEQGADHLINEAIERARKEEPVASAALVLALSEHIERVGQPAAGEVEWEQAKWGELKADDEKTGAPEGDTIRLAWEDGTVLVGRLTVPSIGSGHHQICRMQTVFGGDTYVWPHGATLTRKARQVQPDPAPELAEVFPGTLAVLDNPSIRPEVQS